ncbi:SpoIIE family protein phosphatase [Oerskovia sp. M15]
MRRRSSWSRARASSGAGCWEGGRWACAGGSRGRIHDDRAGGALVLYSDGLFERRDESLKVGLRRLAGSFAEHVGDVDAVLRATRDPASEDDATLLVLRRRALDGQETVGAAG